MQVPEDRDLILHKDSLRYTFSDSIIKFWDLISVIEKTKMQYFVAFSFLSNYIFNHTESLRMLLNYRLLSVI